MFRTVKSFWITLEAAGAAFRLLQPLRIQVRPLGDEAGRMRTRQVGRDNAVRQE